MAEAIAESLCKIEKEETSSFEIKKTLPDDKHNFVSQYIIVPLFQA